MQAISDFWARMRRLWPTLRLLVARDLRQRVSGTAFGVLWLLLDPLFYLAIYTFLFGLVLKVRFGAQGGTLDYAFYLMAGLMPYSAFQEAVNRSTTVLIESRGLVEHTRLPPALLVPVVCVASVITEALGLSLLVVFEWLGTGRISPWLLALPLLVAIRLALSLGIGWLVAIFSAFLRDIGQVVRMLLTLGMFVTPIMYPAEMVPPAYRWLLLVNPMAPLIEAYRDLILRGQAPGAALCYPALFALGVWGVGFVVFKRLLGRAKDFL